MTTTQRQEQVQVRVDNGGAGEGIGCAALLAVFFAGILGCGLLIGDCAGCVDAAEVIHGKAGGTPPVEGGAP